MGGIPHFIEYSYILISVLLFGGGQRRLVNNYPVFFFRVRGADILKEIDRLAGLGWGSMKEDSLVLDA